MLGGWQPIMALLRIPPEAKPFLKKVLGLSPETLSKLTAWLREQPPALDVSGLAARLNASGVGVNQKDAEPILALLTTLYSVAKQTELEPEAFAAKLREAIVADKDLPSTGLDAFLAQLTDLLKLHDSLGITSKAIEVLTEDPHVFLGARIITDMRPVFPPEVTRAPTAAVIVHNLKLEYQHAGGNGEFFIALDKNDIEKLRKVLDRAVLKENSIRELLSKAGVKCLME